MKKFKALIIDLDDTTVPSGWMDSPPQHIIDAVSKARGKVKVSVATGRTYDFCKVIIASLGLADPCIVGGGSAIIDPKTETILWEEKMTAEVVNKILKIVRKYPYDIDLGDVNELVKKDEIFTRKLDVLYIGGITPEDAVKIQHELLAIPEIAPIATNSWEGDHLRDIHVTSSKATKKQALAELKKLLGISKEEVIAVGDSPNDLPLFEEAGFKVAMGNAIPQLKEKADYIAPTIKEDGLIDVINKFILNT